MENKFPVESRSVDFNASLDKNKPLNEQVKQYVDAMAIEKALTDESLKNEIIGRKRQELLNNAETQLKNEKAESKKADVEIQKVEYGIFEGVAKYAGITHHLPIKLQQVVFTMLSIFIGILMVLVCPITCTINVAIEQVASVVDKLNTVTKSVRRIVISLLVIGALFLVAFLIIKMVVKWYDTRNNAYTIV